MYYVSEFDCADRPGSTTRHRNLCHECSNVSGKEAATRHQAIRVRPSRRSHRSAKLAARHFLLVKFQRAMHEEIWVAG